jgi:hypothetical protein
LSFGMSFLLIPFFTCANFKEIAGQVQHSPYQNIQDGLKPADR